MDQPSLAASIISSGIASMAASSASTSSAPILAFLDGPEEGAYCDSDDAMENINDDEVVSDGYGTEEELSGEKIYKVSLLLSFLSLYYFL